MQQAAPQARPGGGFNQGMGQFNDHLDENAMQQAVQQKALSQQAGSQTGPIKQNAPGAPQQPQSAEAPSLFDTTVSRPIQDIAKTILEAMHLDKLLGLFGTSDTPEDKAKKQAMMRRYNQLTEEEQAVARQKYQKRMQEEKARQQEEEQKKRIAEQKKQDTVVMPSSGAPKGPDAGGGRSKKSNAIQKLQQDRKTLGGPQNVG